MLGTAAPDGSHLATLRQVGALQGTDLPVAADDGRHLVNLEGQLVTMGPAGPTSVSDLVDSAGQDATAQASNLGWADVSFADGGRYVVATACGLASFGEPGLLGGRPHPHRRRRDACSARSRTPSVTRNPPRLSCPGRSARRRHRPTASVTVPTQRRTRPSSCAGRVARPGPSSPPPSSRAHSAGRRPRRSCCMPIRTPEGAGWPCASRWTPRRGSKHRDRPSSSSAGAAVSWRTCLSRRPAASRDGHRTGSGSPSAGPARAPRPVSPSGPWGKSSGRSPSPGATTWRATSCSGRRTGASSSTRHGRPSGA